MKTHLALALALSASTLAALPAQAETLTLALTDITEWKAVYGRVESRDTVPARARIGGVIVALSVSEGDMVSAGQEIAVVRDDKIAFQIAAIDAQIAALDAQLKTAESELKRGETLLGQGVVTRQRLDQLRTSVEVTAGQIAAAKANREVIIQSQAEGSVLAPADGRVLGVPATRGAVIMPGEAVAEIGSGGFYLRLAIPERFATSLKQGAAIRITAGGGEQSGRLAKIYPRIENGRVVADVEVEGLATDFVDARVLVEVPVGTRQALVIPKAAVETRSGLDFVSVEGAEGRQDRVVVVGRAARLAGSDVETVEIMSGLSAGDRVIVDE